MELGTNPQYQTTYKDNTITKEDIFFYTYGLLHSPRYRTKYQANLVRGIPNIPMAPNFWAFSEAGHKLADLHLNYETCHRHPLKLVNPIPDNPRSIRFGRKDNSRAGPKTTDDPTILIVDGITVFEKIPVCKYKVNGKTPVEWLTWTPQASKAGIDRDPFRLMTDKEFHAMVERLVHVGIESDRIISQLPEEFEGMEAVTKEMTGLQASDNKIQTRLS